ncbi:MAG: hypothetical protein ACI8QD_002545 [Cyclobacteriaceae bacterium]|jgi:hypothetical protein
MRRILTTLSHKWPEYLIEAIVIVASILAAYALDNWNEDRKELSKETKILKELIKGLEEDRRDIDYNLKNHEKALESQDVVLAWLESNRSYHDRLAFHFANCFRNTAFISNESTYATLKISGMALISNDSIREELTQLYDRTYESYLIYENEGFNLLRQCRENLSGVFFSYIPYDGRQKDLQGSMVPRSPTTLKSNASFGYWLKTYRAHNIISISLMQSKVKRVNHLIEHIKTSHSLSE